MIVFKHLIVRVADKKRGEFPSCKIVYFIIIGYTIFDFAI